MTAPTSPADDHPPRLTFRAVTPARWGDMEQLFEEPGAPKFCWCMIWRATPEERKKLRDGRGRKRAMAKRVAIGTPVGILGYAGKEPVAWCSVAPRVTYRPMGGPAEEPGERIWAIICFFIPRRRRGQGLMRALLAAAIDHARKKGATVVEAYPVDRNAPSYRFMGFVPVFAEFGFGEIGRVGHRRHVMRLALR